MDIDIADKLTYISVGLLLLLNLIGVGIKIRRKHKIIKLKKFAVNSENINSAKRLPSVDYSFCIGCEACSKVCHKDALKMYQHGAVLYQSDACVGCGKCLRVCPMKAIKFKIDQLGKTEA